MQPDHGFNGLALGEVEAKMRERAGVSVDQVLGLEPVAQEGERCRRRACVAVFAPRTHLAADFCDEGRKKLVVGAGP